MLSLDSVTKNYGSFPALTNISLDFTEGVHALLAPNGAGKTTLIKMLATLIFPTRGEIRYNGDEIIRLGASYRDVIGYLPQDFGYYRNHTPREFLRYLAALKCLPRSQVKHRVDELLDLVGLADVRDRKMRKFSGGMVQRVGIAQAMLNDPRILILDEPTSGLDPKERVRFRNLISSLSRDRIVILSTHIVSDVETIANQVIMLKDTRLFSSATPAELCTQLEGKVFEWEKNGSACLEAAPADAPSTRAPSIAAAAPADAGSTHPTGTAATPPPAGSAGRDGREADGPVLLPTSYLVLTERQEGSRTITRFVSDAGCPEGARPVAANLEDVFLHAYRDEG